MKMMDAEEIISFIQNSEKSTPVKVHIKGDLDGIDFGENTKAFITGNTGVLFGEWKEIKSAIEANKDKIKDYVVENDRRNSAIPLLDLKDVPARIEPGAIIRDQVEIGKNCVIMMGASINIGSVIGEGTMIDMNVVLGGRATVGRNCHIGAGSVLAGVVEPPSAKPVIVEDEVVVGANAVILERVTVGKGAVVAAGAVVTEDVPENAVVAGAPARMIKRMDEQTRGKTEIKRELRQLKEDERRD
ncbi:2,3,4,5-tetrahydropyridine-2,6-dicarboxylate N-acetyltransferase [Lentibacillus salicampi]|uniref:2,3,4,5-tetrahydropyridine-2,6-dicarboxylate N-acetyltransferase n=1 Tax=Lentibacillus salicampi TaxID=175306 RepID=A0A4Y9AFM5_9BACI|nr:2,3,4,5-tetrahydropyridine-2,6-dicarboxylate N-acetyltransferase [Lentibacillus salicampi]TFJ94613.1 2,3,4,5-tetrahydropyridine-2,6-dicarboxylate N-acetyltransferase [Lentibacillus salicampi]